MTVGQATDPTTDPNWDPSKNKSGGTDVAWAIFVDGSTTPTWGVVGYDVDSGGSPTFTGAVISLNSPMDRTCYGPSQVTTSFSLSTNTYGVSFPANCLGDPASFSVEGALEYNDGTTVVPTQYIDQEPIGGVTCCTVTTPNPIPASQHGYWLAGSDGGVFSFGAAQFFGSTAGMKLQRPIVGITPTADNGGYWLVASDGGVFSFGDAGYYGSIPALGLAPAGSSSPKRLNAPIVGAVPSADGGGYFLVASDGGVFTFGDAKFEGSCPGIGGCSGAAVAVMPDTSGNGYWLVTSTGHVYSFGDAVYQGAPGQQTVPVTAAARHGGRGRVLDPLLQWNS